jgi:hypothetical protein
MGDMWFSDWQIVIGAVKYWLAGGDPYGAFPSNRGIQYHPGAFAYPPPALLLGAPLALLPWWLSGFLIMLLSIIGFEYWGRRSSGNSCLLWLVLWLPFAQGLWIGQVTLLSLVGLALADRAYSQRQHRRAGILLALALIKPQTVILPIAYMLIQALRARRWPVLVSFALVSAFFWGGVVLFSGLDIYSQWIEGLRQYGPYLPNRPLIFPPFGPILAMLAGFLWWRYGRRDPWGTLLLLNTLLFPLSVVYVAVGIAFVVIRWRPDGPRYPLALSWFIPLILIIQRTPDGIASLTQAIIATGLLAGLCPVLPWRRWFARRPLSPQ